MDLRCSAIERLLIHLEFCVQTTANHEANVHTTNLGPGKNPASLMNVATCIGCYFTQCKYTLVMTAWIINITASAL